MRVNNGNLESALRVMKRKMDSSGIERLIKREQIYHLKNSQKRVLARQRLERRIQSEDFNRKLKAILFRKLRYAKPRTLKNITACCKIHSRVLL